MEHATPRETHDEESSQQLAELQLEETEDGQYASHHESMANLMLCAR